MRCTRTERLWEPKHDQNGGVTLAKSRVHIGPTPIKPVRSRDKAVRAEKLPIPFYVQHPVSYRKSVRKEPNISAGKSQVRRDEAGHLGIIADVSLVFNLHAHLQQCLFLYLADAFASNTQTCPHFFKGFGPAIIQSETHRQNPAFP
jgi:hypothetical protein